MDGRGRAHYDARWNNQEGLRVLGVEPIQQAASGAGSKAWARFLPGLNKAELTGPRAKIGKRPVVLKAGSGPKEGSKWQQFGARNISTGGAASWVGLCGPELSGVQAGLSNSLRDLKVGKRGVWGLKKALKGARSGPSGDFSGSEEKRRVGGGGGASPRAKGSSDLQVDPAWICARGSLPHTFEGSPGSGETPRFESCWEQGLWMVPAECPISGCSGQGNAAERYSDGSSYALQEMVPKSPKAEDHKELRSHTKGPRFETMSSTDCSSPLFSVFCRPLLSRGPSGLGDFLENETLGNLEPLRMVPVYGKEWGKGTDSAQ